MEKITRKLTLLAPGGPFTMTIESEKGFDENGLKFYGGQLDLIIARDHLRGYFDPETMRETENRYEAYIKWCDGMNQRPTTNTK